VVKKVQKIKPISRTLNPPNTDFDNILDRLASFDTPEEEIIVITDVFGVADNILDDLGQIEADISRIQEQRPDFQPPRRKALIFSDSTDVLSELGSLFLNCRICNNGILKHELINGLCFECHNKSELVQEKEHLIVEDEFKFEPLLNRIRELESQVRELRSKLDANLQSNTLFSSPTVHSTPPPPPPAPSAFNVTPVVESQDINFSEMTLEELKALNPILLGSLSLHQKNLFNTRLKELEELQNLTPSQKAEYLKRKEHESLQALHLNEFKNALKNLEELGNPLFAKMREQAEQSAITGYGTFGSFSKKTLYIPCYSCGDTNELEEDDEFRCKFCQAPLSER